MVNGIFRQTIDLISRGSNQQIYQREDELLLRYSSDNDFNQMTNQQYLNQSVEWSDSPITLLTSDNRSNEGTHIKLFVSFNKDGKLIHQIFPFSCYYDSMQGQ